MPHPQRTQTARPVSTKNEGAAGHGRARETAARRDGEEIPSRAGGGEQQGVATAGRNERRARRATRRALLGAGGSARLEGRDAIARAADLGEELALDR